ncbi:MAG TPA: glutamate synthase-related protein, partial [Candidatus Binatus sp.]|nr:glutamate synthase-related protein [Candidatus Binatus sp.]
LQGQVDILSVERDNAVADAGYDRFRIETKPAENLFRVPNRFDVRAKRLRLAVMLLHETIHYRFNRKIVLSRPCIYGVFGGRLGGFKPIKQRCVGCMRCVQEYPHIMQVDYSKEYRKIGDSYWTPEAVSTILYEASTGKIPIKGMGFKGRFGGEGWDGMWTDMSEIVRPTRDGVFGREYISTTVDVGRKPAFLDFSSGRAQTETRRLVQSPLPICFTLPAGIANSTIEASILSVSSSLRLFDLAERSPSNNRSYDFDVPVIKKEEDFERVNDARMVEIDFLEAENEGLVETVRQAENSTLLCARLALDDKVEEKACKLVQDGIDVLHLCADYHGLDYSTSPTHVSESLRRVHSRLVKEGMRDQTTILVSGGITLAEHVPKAIICGADLVGLDTTLLVALQAEFRGEARKRSSPEIIAKTVDVDWGTQRITNLLGAWHDQLIEILSAMGMRDVRRLRGDVGRSMTDAELREQAFKEIARAQQ